MPPSKDVAQNGGNQMEALPKKYSSKSRNDKRSVSTFVEPDMFRRLGLARIEEDKTIQRIVYEALEMWLAAHEPAFRQTGKD